MGILINAVAILLGGIIGSFVKKQISVKKFSIFGVCVAIISLVSFIENVFEVSENALKGEGLYLLIFSLLVGYGVGELLKLDSRINKLPLNNKKNKGFSESCMFFVVGGLQISGPILLGVCGDSSLLYLKSAIDLPFATMFGALYGISVIFSALPVALVQIIITAIGFFAGDIISGQMIAQLCAIGYVILFFNGINMLSDGDEKISTINLLPSIPL